jgi:hypothetical protein
VGAAVGEAAGEVGAAVGEAAGEAGAAAGDAAADAGSAVDEAIAGAGDGAGAEGGAAEARPWPNCFPPDTLVGTQSGLRPIAQIEAGEPVWAYDFRSGLWRLCAVEARHDSIYEGPLVTVEVAGAELTATAYHPFWVVEGRELEARPAMRHVEASEDRGGSLAGRWVNSHDLRQGDVVFLRDGGAVAIRRVEQHPARTPVCNLTVPGLHTFAVGGQQALVHNTSGTTGAPEPAPLHLDIGGEGFHPDAVNVNPSPVTTTGIGAPAGQPIPNLVQTTGENLAPHFAPGSAAVVTIENTPITPTMASQVASVTRPGGQIILQHPADAAQALHPLVIQAVPGCTVDSITIGAGSDATTITVITKPGA